MLMIWEFKRIGGTRALEPTAGQALAYPVLLDPSYLTNYMTKSEAAYCAWNPIDCTYAWDSSKKALAQARSWYVDSTLYKGIGDAFRHCYWNGRMEIRLSTDDAYQFATRHESDSRGVDKEMDMRNNSIGRGIGRSKTGQSSATTKVRDACRSAQRQGKLWITRNGSLVRSSS
ncbi:DUF6973 domain-containing protein [Streptomyces cadmiisoli]|uniref:DUF6973 domain-containing protein n=1 Tax=Streptomyces cadmiisoli TaxID=2184053 RepID=UPI0036646181